MSTIYTNLLLRKKKKIRKILLLLPMSSRKHNEPIKAKPFWPFFSRITLNAN